MKTDEIRQAFLSYFEQHGHTVVESASLVPHHDPSLLFTNAGMVPFKHVFIGQEKRPYTRATSAQRCVRAGGKHNDLDAVGLSNRHHTLFEMLGNFSFGDYFKEEAIRYAWDFLTDVLKLPVSRLWVSVYHDDEEAYRLWSEVIGVAPERICRCGDADNFWSMGDTGPCGPCTEIFYDHGDAYEGGPPGSPEQDGPRYVEIWNVVFMQYDRDSQGKLTPLPKPCVDTGMGLERVAAVMQDVSDNYDTDVFLTLKDVLMPHFPDHQAHPYAWRVMADHMRACVALLADQVHPSNEGRGYVLRRILRRACRFCYQAGGDVNTLPHCIPQVIAVMTPAMPWLAHMEESMVKTIRYECELFFKTLQHGMQYLADQIKAVKYQELSGEVAFLLYDTYGFPLDLTVAICQESQIRVNHHEFEQCMQAQRERSRAKQSFKPTVSLPHDLNPTVFVGHVNLQEKSQCVALLTEDGEVSELCAGQAGMVIVDQSPFYPEGGGQVGDEGILQSETGCFVIRDTQKMGDIILHVGVMDSGTLTCPSEVNLQVGEKRWPTVLNHSATHLLHAALRARFGEKLVQKGSLVAPDRLRFDFSHDHALTEEDIQAIEWEVNQKIQENLQGHSDWMSLDEAKAQGAMALFGEKYAEDKVRVVRFGEYSCELCGGTHVQSTAVIGLFKIVQQSSVASGIRRVEAVTGMKAIDWMQQTHHAVQTLGKRLKSTPAELLDRVDLLLDEQKRLTKSLQRSVSDQLSLRANHLIQQAFACGGHQWVVADVPFFSPNDLRELADFLRGQGDHMVVVLASTQRDEAIHLLTAVSKQSEVDAKVLMKYLTEKLDGSGGGRPDLCQGRGLNVSALKKVLASMQSWYETTYVESN